MPNSAAKDPTPHENKPKSRHTNTQVQHLAINQLHDIKGIPLILSRRPLGRQDSPFAVNSSFLLGMGDQAELMLRVRTRINSYNNSENVCMYVGCLLSKGEAWTSDAEMSCV